MFISYMGLFSRELGITTSVPLNASNSSVTGVNLMSPAQGCPSEFDLGRVTPN